MTRAPWVLEFAGKDHSHLNSIFSGDPLKREFTILIADRNRHVREFLKRELTTEGYQVRLAKSGQEVLRWIYDKHPLDLLILDLDLPDGIEPDLLQKIEDRTPTLPVVLHGFFSDYADHPNVLGSAVFVEKRGNSVEQLKKVVFKLLRKAEARLPEVTDDIERLPAESMEETKLGE